MKSIIHSMIFLPEYFKIINGRKSACIINIKVGEYTLINHSASELLSSFKRGNTPHNVLKNNFNSTQFKDTISFLENAINLGILTFNQINKTFLNSNNNNRTNKQFNSSSLSLTLELSRQCNLECLHCYNNSGKNVTTSLSKTSINKLLKDTRNLFNSYSILTLTGGEPFLYKDICDVIQESFDIGFSKVRINTNGTINPNKKFKKLISKYSENIEIQVTLLGASPHTHDFISSVKGSYRKTLLTINSLLETNARVTGSLMKSKKLNKIKVEKLKKILGIEITLGDIYPIGRAKNNYKLLNIGKSIDILPHMNEFKNKFIKLSDEKKNSLKEKFPPELPCGKNTFSVSANGDLLPCALLQNIIIGNIYKDSINNILNSQKMSKFYKDIAIDNRITCNMCELKYVCENKCPAVSLYYGGKLGVKNPFCNYYK